MSDTHLGFCQYGLEQRAQDFRDAFLDATRQMLEQGVTVIGVAGDVFHHAKPASREVAFLQYIEGVLRPTPARMLVTSGNHDLATPSWSAALFSPGKSDRITNMDCQHFFDLASGIGIVGIPFMSKERFMTYPWPEKNADVLLMHQAITEFVGYKSPQSIDLAELPVHKFKLIICGDTHINRTERIGDCVICSPGSTEMNKKDEPDDKFFGTAEIEAGQPVEVTWHRINTRKVVRLTLTEDGQASRELAETALLPSGLVYINYDVSLPDIANRIDTALDRSKFVVVSSAMTNEEQMLQVSPAPMVKKEFDLKEAIAAELGGVLALADIASQLADPQIDARTTLNNYVDAELASIAGASAVGRNLGAESAVPASVAA